MCASVFFGQVGGGGRARDLPASLFVVRFEQPADEHQVDGLVHLFYGRHQRIFGQRQQFPEHDAQVDDDPRQIGVVQAVELPPADAQIF